jgi:signal transduction histidine kinase
LYEAQVSRPTFDLLAARQSPAEAELDIQRARSAAVIKLTLALWLANYAIGTLAAYVGDDSKFLLLAAMRAGLLCVGLVLCAAIHKLLAMLSHIAFAKRIAVVIFASVVAAEIYGWLSYFGFMLLAPERLGKSINWATAISNGAVWTWFFLAWAGLRLALEYSWEAKDQQRRAIALQALAHSAKLRALHSQVNPHFLFNSLNSIATLIIDERRRDADKMVGKLADFFRLTLAVDPEEEIPLELELVLQLTYLEIEQLRFPDLKISTDIAADVAEASIPALLLQPIIENAVKYGVASSEPPAVIAIAAFAEGDQLVITVEDRGSGASTLPKAGGGIGLNNVRSRLHERFGADASLEAERIAQIGFVVTIRMPLIYP